jgi:hypothetical protein
MSIMSEETPEFELTRLLKEQGKTREDEVFIGQSPAERVAYESKADRIYELECDLVEPVHRGLRNLALHIANERLLSERAGDYTSRLHKVT